MLLKFQLYKLVLLDHMPFHLTHLTALRLINQHLNIKGHFHNTHRHFKVVSFTTPVVSGGTVLSLHPSGKAIDWH